MPLVFLNPPISLSTAHSLAVFFAGSYVGSLYLSKNARLTFKKAPAKALRDGEQRLKENDERWRDDPDVIRARLSAVTLSTASSCAVVLGLVWKLIGWGVEVCPFSESCPCWLCESKLTGAHSACTTEIPHCP